MKSSQQEPVELPFHKYIEERIDASNISQREMAEELNYPNPNIITMWKQGKTKVVLTKIPKLAGILKIDPKVLFRRAMSEYDPELLKLIESLFGDALSKNEREIISEIRRLSGNLDPRMSSIQSRQVLEKFVTSLSTH